MGWRRPARRRRLDVVRAVNRRGAAAIGRGGKCMAAGRALHRLPGKALGKLQPAITRWTVDDGSHKQSPLAVLRQQITGEFYSNADFASGLFKAISDQIPNGS